MKYSPLYLQDLVFCQSSIPDIHKLNNTSIIITGAGGMIGSAIVDFLLAYNDSFEANVMIYVAARNKQKILQRFGERFFRPDFCFIEYDAVKQFICDKKIDYIIHAASPANPAEYTDHPVETMWANLNGIKELLEYTKNNNVKRLLYISSSEIYGKNKNNNPYKEDEYGYVDILNPRACYPSAKRAAETLCASYQKEYGVDYVVVRPGHIYGPTAVDSDDRAATQFIKNAVTGSDIIMKSNGAQIRSHCYVLDCVTSIITVLLEGQSGRAYNISNPNSISSIKEYADNVADIAHTNVIFEKPSDREKEGYNMMDNSSLDSTLILELGWTGLFNLKKGIEHTIKIMHESNL